MTQDPPFAPLDPIADLRDQVSLEEAQEALSLAFQHLVSNTESEWIQLRDNINSLLQNKSLIQPLRMFYCMLSDEIETRLAICSTVAVWAEQHQIIPDSVVAEPEQWRVSLRTGATTVDIGIITNGESIVDEPVYVISTPYK